MRIRAHVMAALFLCGAFAARSQESDATSTVQNAVLEGVNITTESGASADEKIVTCYFIFKDKPSSYFFNKVKDPRTKEKKIIFDFNDTELGSSPISYETQPPINSFKIDKKRIDANAEVKGLNPEWHDIMVVTMNVSNFPKEFSPNDQYNIISFSYKWSTDPNKIALYAESDKKSPVVPITLSSVGGVALAAGLWFFLKPKETPPAPEPLPTNDLPVHQPRQ
jgi:hypothetical protein